VFLWAASTRHLNRVFFIAEFAEEDLVVADERIETRARSAFSANSALKGPQLSCATNVADNLKSSYAVGCPRRAVAEFGLRRDDFALPITKSAWASTSLRLTFITPGRFRMDSP